MMACKDCKNWADEDADVDWDARAVGMRLCLAVRERWRIQNDATRAINWAGGESLYVETRKNSLIQAQAFVQDGSEYRAELVTGPDFFCAKFETKV